MNNEEEHTTTRTTKANINASHTRKANNKLEKKTERKQEKITRTTRTTHNKIK